MYAYFIVYITQVPRKPVFNYDMHANKAYIYDWSSARHISLPDGTLENFGGTLQVN